jgi:hypothetical protein
MDERWGHRMSASLTDCDLGGWWRQPSKSPGEQGLPQLGLPQGRFGQFVGTIGPQRVQHQLEVPAPQRRPHLPGRFGDPGGGHGS